MKYEVPFTSDCGCLHETFTKEGMDINKLMPLYYSIYNKYWDMVVKPLNAVNQAFSNGFSRKATSVKTEITKIDQVKLKGECLTRLYVNEKTRLVFSLSQGKGNV